MTHLYELGDNVCANDIMYMVLAKTSENNEPSYILRKLDGDDVVTGVLETSCKDCSAENIINYFWDKFTYTGDNNEASNFIMECILKKIKALSNVEYGPNEDNTQYIFSINSGSNYWTKNIQ